MRKLRALTLLLAFSLLLSSASLAVGNLRAAAPVVIYDAAEDEEKFYFSLPGGAGEVDTPVDLFPNFKDLMPGDTEPQAIQLEVRGLPNDKQVEIFLHAEVPEADKAVLAPLTIRVDGSNVPETQGSVTAETSLGVFRGNNTLNLNVTLNVPRTLGNEFQDKVGHVNWVFTARTVQKYDKLITLHPESISSYAGSVDMPTLRFQVLVDGQPWDGENISFQLHQPDKPAAEQLIDLSPTRVPGSDSYFAFPVLEKHLDLTGSGILDGKKHLDNYDDNSHGHDAGSYDLVLEDSKTWHIDATDETGANITYNVWVDTQRTHISVLPVAEANPPLTPVLGDEDSVNTAGGESDEVYGRHRAVAVVPADAVYYTNGKSSDLGMYGGAAPSISLLFDEPVALSDALQTEDMAALMMDHAGHADEWGGPGFSFKGWQYDFRYLALVNTDDGNAWVSCNKPVVIYWPYPAEVRDRYQDYEFQILHYVGENREYFQIPLDDAEQWGQTVLCDARVPVQSLAVTSEAQGLRFTLSADPEGDNFSPFVLMWKAKGETYPDPGPSDDDDDDDINVTVKKTWKLDDGGTAPDAVTVALLRNGREYATARLSAANGWKHTWTGLDELSRWTVEEKDVPEGFTSSVESKGGTFTITNNDTPDSSAQPAPGSSTQPPPGSSAQPAPGSSAQPAPGSSQDAGTDPTPQDPGSGTTPQDPGALQKGPTLPQTGQDWRTVFLLAAAGFVLLFLGFGMGKAGKGKHED